MSTQAGQPTDTALEAPSATNRGRFAWHELMTTDTAGAKEFYTNVVGWSTAKWGESDASADYTMWMAGQVPVGGVMTLPAEAAANGAPPNWLAYNEVPDVDATVEQTKALGGDVVMPAHSMEGVGRFAVLKDPQGVIFAVITNANPLSEETDPQPLEFSWHELITTDAKAALEFYGALFGWEKQSEFDMGPMGVYHLYGRGRFQYGGAYDKPAEMPFASWLHYARVPDSADAAAERAKAAGGTVINGPMEVPGGDRIAVIRDPQGGVFAVHSKPAT